MAACHCAMHTETTEGDNRDLGLYRILLAHRAHRAGEDAELRVRISLDDLRSRLFGGSWQRCWERLPNPRTLPLKVRHFLRVDFVRHRVWDDICDASDLEDEVPLDDIVFGYERNHPEDLNRRVINELLEVGEQAMADALRNHPTHFWLTYQEGWAEATATVSEFLAREMMNSWASELVDAAKQCLSLSPSGGRRFFATRGDTRVELPSDYQLDIPDLVPAADPDADPPQIWLRPNVPAWLGPLPVELHIDCPEMTVDEGRLAAMFDGVPSIEHTDAGCPVCGPGITIVGKYLGDTVELAFKRRPLSPVPYTTGVHGHRKI
jgi:hypothetical protein